MSFKTSRNAFLLLVLILVLVTDNVNTAFILRAANPAEYPSLLDASIESLGSGLAQRKFTSVDLVKAYLATITEVQEDFHAVTEVNPDALLIAAGLDKERLHGSLQGPLHGIPLLIKNIIATDDKMNNTAGSWALLGAKVPRDATVAKKLRDAGAILLGKSSLTQWANFRSDNSSNGWSSLGGQVYGPYFPRQDPWGSSSGSGVGAALGLASGCLGTETDGSITSPASSNNIVGIKPTVGLTSRYLVIPISEHQDTVGPMARSVKDAAYILQAIVGLDPHDNYTSNIPHVPNYVKACKHSALSGIRLGIPRNAISLELDSSTQPQIKALNQAIKVLRATGATVIDNTNFTAAEEFWNSDIPGRVLQADFVVNLQGYLASLTRNPNDIHSLDHLRNFTQHYPLEEYPLRDTGVWDATLSGWNNTDPRFWSAYQQNLYYGGDGGLLGAMDRFKLDAIVMPADFAAHWAATVGTPIVTVPLGFYPSGTPVVKDSWGLVESAPKIPFGISFMGRKFSEEKLIGMAYAFEQRTKVIPPKHQSSRVSPYDTSSKLSKANMMSEMQKTSSFVETEVSYLVKDLKHDKEKPYELTFAAGGLIPQTNISYQPHQVSVYNFRGLQNSDSFNEYGFTVTKLGCALAAADFNDDTIVKDRYYPAVEKLLWETFSHASAVRIIEHGLRKRSGAFPGGEGASEDVQPATRVHADYSIDSADRTARASSKMSQKAIDAS
ncbi:hypothetical protein IFR05_007202 [Cadophora sp. M221]|nr:hypothetical protein IFR05_007202 [Cadophora sp. M221]